MVGRTATVCAVLTKTARTRIRHARFKAGLTVEQLATKARVSERFIYDLELGPDDKKHLGTKVYAVVEALGLDPDTLFEELVEEGAK